MISYLGKQETKDFYLERVKQHEDADQIIKGRYWSKGKGCAVGCTVHMDNGMHQAYETQLGIPIILARLEDGIFESLPNGLAMTWPRRFLEAVPVGVDLSKVWPAFAIWMLIDQQWGVLQFAKEDQSKKAIIDVANAYQAFLKNPKKKIDWQKLRSDAADADAYAAAAAAAYAAYADAYAAYAAAAAAAYAAYAADAAYAAAYAAAKSKWRVAQSEKLIELLQNTKEEKIK